jgi:hypothetical protein
MEIGIIKGLAVKEKQLMKYGLKDKLDVVRYFY